MPKVIQTDTKGLHQVAGQGFSIDTAGKIVKNGNSNVYGQALTTTDTNEHSITSIDLTDFQTVGNVVRIKVTGVTTAKTGSPGHLTMFATFDGATHAAGGDVPIVSLNSTEGVANKSFFKEYNLIITAVGSSGAVAGHAVGIEHNDGTTLIQDTSAGAVAVDFDATPFLHLVHKTAGGSGSAHTTTTVSVEIDLIGKLSS